MLDFYNLVILAWKAADSTTALISFKKQIHAIQPYCALAAIALLALQARLKWQYYLHIT